jgi:hypothetical protein
MVRAQRRHKLSWVNRQRRSRTIQRSKIPSEVRDTLPMQDR